LRLRISASIATSTVPRLPNFIPRFTPSSIAVPFKMTDTNQGGDPTKKTYHKKATGNAWTTVKNHSKEDSLKLYGSAFWYVYSRPSPYL
jgi:hypothetical protein